MTTKRRGLGFDGRTRRRRASLAVAAMLLAWTSIAVAPSLTHAATSSQGLLFTLLGGPQEVGFRDSEARVGEIAGVAATPDGRLLVSDKDRHAVRLLLPGGRFDTVAGTGADRSSGDGGPATRAGLRRPTGLAVLRDGGFLVADSRAHRIRRVTPAGEIRTFAGTGRAGFSGDGGPAIRAQLNSPWGLAVRSDGSVLIADLGNRRVRHVSTNGVITTLAGSGSRGFSGDGGPATAAALDTPTAVADLGGGAFAVADAGNYRVRRVSSGGRIATIAGNAQLGVGGDGGPAIDAALEWPTALAVLPGGDLLVGGGGRVRALDRTGRIRLVAGGADSGRSSDARPAKGSTLFDVSALAVMPDGGIVIGEDSSPAALRFVAPARTRVFAAAAAPQADLATPSRFSVGIATTRPGRLLGELARGSTRSRADRRVRAGGVRPVRLFERVAPAPYRLRLTLRATDGRLVVLSRGRPVFLGGALPDRWSRRLAAVYARERQFGTPVIVDRCRRLSGVRVDCRLTSARRRCQEIVAVRVRSNGRVSGNGYSCDRGFQRSPAAYARTGDIPLGNLID